MRGRGVERLLSPSLSSILNGGEGARRAGEEALRTAILRLRLFLHRSNARAERADEGVDIMLDLARYFTNPFNDRRITLGRLITFAAKHLVRMVMNNPGALLDGRIAATSVALGALEATMTDDISRLGARKARVQGKEAFRKALPEHLGQIHGAVVAVFGPKSPEVRRCFPKGRSEFITCRDHALEAALRASLAALTPLAAQVGQGPVDNLAGLINSWNALLSEKGAASAGKSRGEEARREAKRALAVELFRNVLALASSYPDDLGKAAWYCPQHLLEKTSPAPQAAVA